MPTDAACGRGGTLGLMAKVNKIMALVLQISNKLRACMQKALNAKTKQKNSNETIPPLILADLGTRELEISLPPH